MEVREQLGSPAVGSEVYYWLLVNWYSGWENSKELSKILVVLGLKTLIKAFPWDCGDGSVGKASIKQTWGSSVQIPSIYINSSLVARQETPLTLEVDIKDPKSKLAG